MGLLYEKVSTIVQLTVKAYIHQWTLVNPQSELNNFWEVQFDRILWSLLTWRQNFHGIGLGIVFIRFYPFGPPECGLYIEHLDRDVHDGMVYGATDYENKPTMPIFSCSIDL